MGPKSDIIRKSLSTLDSKIWISYSSHKTIYEKLFSKIEVLDALMYGIDSSVSYEGLSQKERDIRDSFGAIALAYS